MTTIQALNQLLNHHKAPHRAVNFASPFFVSNVVPQCAIRQLDSPHFFVVLFLFSVPEAQSKTMVRHIYCVSSPLKKKNEGVRYKHNLPVLIQVYSLVRLFIPFSTQALPRLQLHRWAPFLLMYRSLQFLQSERMVSDILLNQRCGRYHHRKNERKKVFSL